MFKKIAVYSLKLLLQCVVLSGVFYFVSYQLARAGKFSDNPFSIMQGIGIITILLGALGFTKGNPSGGVNCLGMLNSTQVMNFNTEVTKYERQLFPYHEIFSKNNIVKMDFSALSIVIIGAFTFLIGYLTEII